MKTLFTGIYSAFIGMPHNTLYNVLTGGLFFSQVPARTAYPYGVYFPVSWVPDFWMGGERFEELLVQFNLFTNESSAVNLLTYAGYLHDLYDDNLIAVTGYQTVKFEREFSEQLRDAARNVWQHTTQYRVLLGNN